MNKENGWATTFKNLPRYKTGAVQKYEYTVEEVKVEGYESSITGNADRGFIIANTPVEEEEKPTVIVAVTKEWVDQEDKNGVRPDSITVILLANGEEVDKPKKKEDYVSLSGSRYWFKKDGVIRGSNHWGCHVANCDWVLQKKDGKKIYGSSAFATKTLHAEAFGFARWDEFILKPEIIEIEGEEILTTFENKLSDSLFLYRGEFYKKIVTVSYMRQKA